MAHLTSMVTSAFHLRWLSIVRTDRLPKRAQCDQFIAYLAVWLNWSVWEQKSGNRSWSKVLVHSFNPSSTDNESLNEFPGYCHLWRWLWPGPRSTGFQLWGNLSSVATIDFQIASYFQMENTAGNNTMSCSTPTTRHRHHIQLRAI